MTPPGEALSRPRLVATDLDGTLLRSDGTVSVRTRDALADAERAGISVVFVTARPPRWLHELEAVIANQGLAICANGAIVYDVGRRRVVSVSTMSTADVIGVVTALRTALPGTTFASERAGSFAMETTFLDRHRVPAQALTGPIETLLDELPAKLLARNERLDPADFIHRGRQAVAGLADVHVSGADGLLEMSAVGVNKAAALADWCESHGVRAAEVWAFGDMLNDLPMLSWAGTSFAVANAHPEVIATATYVCASNDDDGVAQQLEKAVELSAAATARP
jgi:Cof subfamily protein (haloacid dehalogenase superfamily)